jgi:hypothetical protein
MYKIGIDFSINKPAAIVAAEDGYKYFIWPHGISENNRELFRSLGINVIKRNDEKLGDANLSMKKRWEIKNSQYLSELMFHTLEKYLNADTEVAFEGSSYGSSGNVILQLAMYSHDLMGMLCKKIYLENLYVYAPQTLKKVAGCSKEKKKGKEPMILAYAKKEHTEELAKTILENPLKIKKKGGKSWVDGLDDIIDSYWALKCLNQ